MAARLLALLAAVAVLVLSSSLAGAFGGNGSAPSAVGAAGLSAAPAVTAQGPSAAVAPSVGSSTPLPIFSPVGVLMDATNATALVESEYGDNLTEVSLKTDAVTSVVGIGDEPYPQALALDPINWTVYVANSGSGNVSVVSVGGADVLASVTVGASPDAVAFNPATKDIYVANSGSSSVSIISPAAKIPEVIATVPVGPDPDGFAVDTATHDVFVACAGSTNVTVISGKTNSVLRTVPVGLEAGAYGSILYDPTTKDVYVANAGSHNVSVIGGKNLTDYASVTVGSSPDALALDSKTDQLFVANRFSDNVSVIAAKNGTIAGSVDVGSQPGVQGGLAVDPTVGLAYVTNSASDNVSVISVADLKVVDTVAVGEDPVAVEVDPVGESAWVANEGSSTVSIFQVSLVTFDEKGLPKGDSWSVSIGAPPVSVSATVGRGKSSASLYLEPGAYPFTVTLPSSFGVARVTGTNAPSQSAIDVSGATSTFTITVGPIESLTFKEVGLPAHAVWALLLQSALSTGGPLAQNATTNTTSMTFEVVKGSWHYDLTKVPSPYVTSKLEGGVTVGVHAVTKTLRFKEVAATVLFEEAGLPSGTFWQVNVTGPVDVSVSSENSTIAFALPSGTYSFEVWNFTNYNPYPETGTFTVVAPHHSAYVVTVSYAYKT